MLSRKKYNRHFAFDRSGIVVFAHGKDLKQFVVSDVIESSPAYEAGVRANDIITKVCFSSSQNLSLDRLNHIFSGKVGKKIKIKVMREGKTLQFTFRLRELL